MKCANILVHYAEVAIKGRNRPRFIKRLCDNIKLALDGLPVSHIQRMSGRLWVHAQEGASFDEEAFVRLRTVFGVATFAPAVRVPLEMTALKNTAWELLADREYKSYRVSARRAFKTGFSSLEVNQQVGGHLQELRPTPVKLKGADVEVHIEMMPHAAFMYVDKFSGPGGLPVGSSGVVGCLLSGGIDSPVAAHRMQRRGLRQVFVHFHSVPYLSRSSMEKAVELATSLSRFQGSARLYLVPFGDLQANIVENAPAALRVILYRRFMMRIAAVLSEREGARALVTGESLGQVASQTLRNLAAINAVAPLPVLRPLIGFDKQEIIAAAQAIGTFETSIIPDQDCCTLFMPRSPETRAHLPTVLSAEAHLDVEGLCASAIERAEVRD
ncbi:MAG TPA: tRNA uracil 4-sulfurtransferase ThiI, partial [Myxococcota bacterium]|nr:tRNA uracil 4-sulfurtransferase ThiI [Myxococcota bacterium]